MEATPQDIAQVLVQLLKSYCPVDEYNLIQTITIELEEDGGIYVGIGGDKLLAYAKAPYAKYTNEKENMHYRAKFKGQKLTEWINRCLEQLNLLYGG